MRGLFLIEHKKATGPSIWSRTIGTYLQDKGIVKTVETYNWSVFFNTLLQLPSYDFIHFYSQTFQSGVLSFAAFLLRKKQFFTVHGNITAELNTKQGTFWYPFKQIFWKPINWYIFRVCQGLTFPSEFNRTANKSWIQSSSRTAVIPNPIVINDRTSIEPFTKGLLKLVIITNFKFPEKERGIDFLANVLATLKTRNINGVLTIIGDGPHLQAYKDKYSSRSDLKFVGHKVPAERDEILKASHLFTYASYLDNMPYVILEAINLGLPAVSIDVGAVSEMLPAEYVIDASKPETYTNKIVSMLNVENFKKAQNTQKQLLKDKFSISTVSEEFINFYKQFFK